jgi:methionine-S-sulfoxide reductase
LAKLFFEIHNPTQTNGQGNDIGEQYLSKIFYTIETQKEISQKLIQLLEGKGLKIATKLLPATKFWSAETYHQKYYEKNGGTPYCHFRKKLF